MSIDDRIQRIQQAANRQRVIDATVRLVSVPSPTRSAGNAADSMAEMLIDDGFDVQRPTGGWDSAPAVAVRLDSGRPGPVIQFDGHLDTVHLPFVPPKVIGDKITGSGSCDMKGGLSAAIEALRIIRESKLLRAGSVLLTAHDLHEAPWGFGEQLDQLIREGCHGSVVLIPEPLNDQLAIRGRGAATWKVVFTRSGPPVHEVARPSDQPSVIQAGTMLAQRLFEFEGSLQSRRDSTAGNESVFIGQIHSGEIYNQYPSECWLEGTRRWLPGTDRSVVEKEFASIVNDVAKKLGANAKIEFRFIRDAFRLDDQSKFVEVFQSTLEAVGECRLATGPKRFVDDGNSFWAAGIPAITYGPRSAGQHTTNEWVSIDDMIRVACIYALTTLEYCHCAET